MRLTRKDFRKAADKIGQIVDYSKRQHEMIAYSYEAKEINPRFNSRVFKQWVERVAQGISDLKRVDSDCKHVFLCDSGYGRTSCVRCDKVISVESEVN